MSMTGDNLTDRIVPVASRVVGAVREWDFDEVAAALAEASQIDPDYGVTALVVVLSAMVPYDASPGDLLRWIAHRNEFDRLVALGLDPVTAATIIHNASRE